MLEQLMHNQFVIAALAGLALFGITFILTRKSGGNQESETEKPNKKDNKEDKPAKDPELAYGEPVLCRVADVPASRIYNEYITYNLALEIKRKYNSLGRKLNREGKQVYGLIKTLENEYKPIPIPDRIIYDPHQFFIDMQQQEVPIVMDVTDDEGFMQKYGHLLWWVAVIAFIMFLWSQS